MRCGNGARLLDSLLCVDCGWKKITHMAQTEKCEIFPPNWVAFKRSLQWAVRITFWRSVEQAYLSSPICVPFLYLPFSSEQPSVMFLCQPQHTHTQAIRFSTSKPSIKTGCGRGFGGKRWDTYPKRFYISWPLDSVRRHSGPACFLSVRIKSSLSHERAKKNLKKEFKNSRCLPPGPVCASPQEYRGNFCLAQIISIYCFNWAHFH